MPPSLPPSLFASCRSPRRFNALASTRLFASTQAQDKGSQNATPGWEGRHGDDHAVKRDKHDSQADAAQQSMKDYAKGKEGSQAISRKDEGKFNQKAKEEHPEAPGPVIGMNDERGGKGH